jgi:hypothetical protein
MLFVIDGAAALRQALRETFGELAVVQRCQVHSVPSRGTRFVGRRVA